LPIARQILTCPALSGTEKRAPDAMFRSDFGAFGVIMLLSRKSCASLTIGRRRSSLTSR